MNYREKFFLPHIAKLQEYVLEKYDLVINIGAELEFYVNSHDVPHIISKLQEQGFILEAERGYWQYEIIFNYTPGLEELCSKIANTRLELRFYCKQHEGSALFAAKPFIEDYGSGLHLHLSLHNQDDNLNAFEAEEGRDLLYRVIAGILDISAEATYLLCKNKGDYLRFEPRFDGPTHISWGGNNRTVLLRIPDIGNKRLEFRLPPASSSISAAVFALCVGVVHGLEQQLALPDRIYGNAFDGQYNLQPLPKDIIEAYNAFANGKKILYYIDDLLLDKQKPNTTLLLEKIIWKNML
jgi:glutamine synthetase